MHETDESDGKILVAHLIGGGELPPAGEVITIQIDEAFTQDATGTMAMFPCRGQVSNGQSAVGQLC
ncbi:hypothetical protein CCP3SC15_2570003 [Gammaproteobacteria bacterium]